MEDIKQTLYAVLGKRKLGKPIYSFNETRAGARNKRFQCHLTVMGINYVGLGISTSKKDAQSNAALDFAQYLIRESIINEKEIPQVQTNSDPMQVHANLAVANLPYQIEEQQPGIDFTENDDANFIEPHDFPAAIHPRLMSKHDMYVEQKAEEISQSEAVDMTAQIHGGWTLENCKQALNEFCQKNRIPVQDYKITKTDTNDSTFIAEYQIFLAKLNKMIYGRGQGSNQKIAKSSCALSVVRQLFHMAILPAAAGVEAAKKNKRKADDLPEIKVQVDQSLVTKLEQYLKTRDIKPIDDQNVINKATIDNPISLLIDQKIEEFPHNEPTSINSTIVWTPPIQNWNAWRATNIDTLPIAFWPMERISNDLMMREKAKTLPPNMVKIKQALPVFKHRQEIIQTVVENPVVLIKGATGCGKSTQICQFLLESYLLDNRGANFNCYVTQPRRISAITLAERVAAERCEELGDSLGYSIRFESVTPRPYGAIMFVTIGVLMRKMEMGLRGISHVIIDEIHERDINTDFLLIIIRDMVRANPKLRVLLMSATIDTTLFTDYFGTCPIIEIKQHMHEVQHFFLEDLIAMLHYNPPVPEPERKKKKKRKNGAAESTADANENDADDNSMALNENLLVCGAGYSEEVSQALSRMNEREIPLEFIEALLTDLDVNGQPGAILIFLPGWNLISLMLNRLMLHPNFSNSRRFVILPLHSQLTAREQHRVFEPVRAEQRKIILSTNIAETSVTIDDVIYVIDSCRVREKMYTSRNNMVHYANVWASRTNLIQRRGRAGRVQKGFCFHLITRARYDVIEEHRVPEMLRTPLHEITLTIKLLRLGSVGAFLEKAVQPPPIDAIVEAEVLLRQMNALDKNMELTDLGRILARLPIEPKLGKVVILGAALGVGDLMLTAAAATSFNSPFVQKERMYTKLSHMHRSFSGNRPSDHVGLINVNKQFQMQTELDNFSAENFCRRYTLSYPLLCMASQAKQQMFDVLVNNTGFPEATFAHYNIDVHRPDENLDMFLSLLIAAYYPNICYIRDRRRVYTLEQAVALLSNMSVCVPFERGAQHTFASPLFMFTEKIKFSNENCQIPRNSFVDEFAALSLQFQLRTNCITCKQVSMITPLQLLMFGSRQVDALGPEKVCLDNMIFVNMPAKIAAQIVALRPCLEGLLVRSCTHPAQLEEKSPEDITLIQVVRRLSLENAWLPMGEEGLQQNTSTAGQRLGLMKQSPAYGYRADEQSNYATPQQERLNIFSGRKRPYGAPQLYDSSQVPGMHQYGNQPQSVPIEAIHAGQEAVAAANGLSNAPTTNSESEQSGAQPQEDFSSMAGPSDYYGTGKQEQMLPQVASTNGFHTHRTFFFPRRNVGMRVRGRGGRRVGVVSAVRGRRHGAHGGVVHYRNF